LFAAAPTSFMGGLPVISAAPEVHLLHAESLQAAILAAAARHPTVVVDLSATRSCDSQAIQVLVRESRRIAREGGELRLVARTAPVLSVLMMLGADRSLAVFPNLIDAVSSGGSCSC
jgi:anti-anti-sigma factor